MLKKLVLKLFSTAILFLFLFKELCFSQNKISNCCLLLDGKAIPVFGELAQVKNDLLLCRDLNYKDSSVVAYRYEGGIVEKAGYLFTPQAVFIVEKNENQKILKQSFSFLVSKSKLKGGITDCSLAFILDNIKLNLPFIDVVYIGFGEKRNFLSSCGAYSISLSRPIGISSTKEEIEIEIIFSR